jgi:hypothetical protein
MGKTSAPFLHHEYLWNFPKVSVASGNCVINTAELFCGILFMSVRPPKQFAELLVVKIIYSVQRAWGEISHNIPGWMGNGKGEERIQTT